MPTVGSWGGLDEQEKGGTAEIGVDQHLGGELQLGTLAGRPSQRD